MRMERYDSKHRMIAMITVNANMINIAHINSTNCFAQVDRTDTAMGPKRKSEVVTAAIVPSANYYRCIN